MKKNKNKTKPAKFAKKKNADVNAKSEGKVKNFFLNFAQPISPPSPFGDEDDEKGKEKPKKSNK